MSCSIHLHGAGHYQISIRLEEDESMAGRLDNIQVMLTQLVEGQQNVMATVQETIQGLKDDMSALGTQITANTDAEKSAVEAFHALADQLAAATASATDLETLRTTAQGFATQLHDSADMLGAGVVAGTPASTGDPVTDV